MKKRLFLFIFIILISMVLPGCQIIGDRNVGPDNTVQDSERDTATTDESESETQPEMTETQKASETVSSDAPGWYLISENPIISENDVTVHPDGGPGGSHMGDSYTDVHRGTIEKPVYEFSIERVFEQGDVAASGSVRLVWEDPPQVLFPGQKASVSADIDLISSWSVANMTVAFEEIEIMPNYSSPTVIRFTTEEGKNIPRGASFSGSVSMEREVPEGSSGDQRAILISFGNGYGYRYIYEWRE